MNARKSIYVSQETHKRFRRYAFDSKWSMQDIADALVRLLLDDPELQKRVENLIEG